MIRNSLSNLLWRFSGWYIKNYNKVTIIPLILISLSIFFLAFHYFRYGTIINEGISLTGGYQVFVPANVSYSLIANYSPTPLHSLFSSKLIGYEFSTPLSFNKTKEAFLTTLSEHGIPPSSVTINYISPELASGAITNAIYLFIIAFILLIFISLIYFRKPYQSFSNVISIISDVINVLGFMSIFGLTLTTASIVGFLMLIGYSADRNAILSSNLLKRREGDLHYRVYHALKTSITMDVAAISVFIVMLLVSSSSTIQSIAEVLLIGVVLDDLVVWILNGSIQLRGIEHERT